MPSTRSLALGAGALGVVGLQGLAAAQSPNAGIDPGFGVGVVIQFLVSLVVYLVLGGSLVAIGPRYADTMVSDLRDDPAGAFGWGLVAGIVAPVVLAILALTIVGLIVAIPGFVVLLVLAVVGNAVTVAWIGSTLADTGGAVDGYTVGVGALVLAIAGAIPLLGGLLTSLLGLFGLGVVSRNAYSSRRGGSGPETSPEREAARRPDDI